MNQKKTTTKKEKEKAILKIIICCSYTQHIKYLVEVDWGYVDVTT